MASHRRTTFRVGMRTLLASLIGLLMLAPFAYLCVGALSESFSLTTTIAWDSWQLTFSNFSDLLVRAELVRPLINSLIVGIAVTVGSLFFCTLCGYVLARRRFRGGAAIMTSVVLVLMIPVHIVIIPLFLLTNWLGMFDTYLALILPFLVNPLGVFLMRQYILGLPVELEEAARLEGASELTIIWRVIMPLCRPALAVLAVQVFLINWNSFLYPFILTSSESLRTLPVALALLAGYQDINIPQLFAASLLSALPVTILFVIYSRRITEGIIAGAVKG